MAGENGESKACRETGVGSAVLPVGEVSFASARLYSAQRSGVVL